MCGKEAGGNGEVGGRNQERKNKLVERQIYEEKNNLEARRIKRRKPKTERGGVEEDVDLEDGGR